MNFDIVPNARKVFSLTILCRGILQLCELCATSVRNR